MHVEQPAPHSEDGLCRPRRGLDGGGGQDTVQRGRGSAGDRPPSQEPRRGWGHGVQVTPYGFVALRQDGVSYGKEWPCCKGGDMVSEG